MTQRNDSPNHDPLIDPECAARILGVTSGMGRRGQVDTKPIAVISSDAASCDAASFFAARVLGHRLTATAPLPDDAARRGETLGKPCGLPRTIADRIHAALAGGTVGGGGVPG